MSKAVAVSPLAHRAPLAAESALSLSEWPLASLYVLRGAPDLVAGPVQAVLGLVLPQAVRQTAIGDAGSLLWIGPDEWAIIGAGENLAALQASLAGQHHQLVEVTDAYAGIEIAGSTCREVLAKLTAIDLHPRAFQPGDAVATNMAKSNIWLWLQPDTAQMDAAAFRLIVRRSHADYLWCLLAEAGREFGLPAQTPTGSVRLHLPHLD